MERESEFTPQQYKKFNGQSIMTAMEYLGGSASADALTQHIGGLINQPKRSVKPEVMQVLRRGITNGFLERRGKTYFLYRRGVPYQYDGKLKRSMNPPFSNNRSSKRGMLSSRNNFEEDLKIYEDRIEEMQHIILNAAEETRKASIIATEAAVRAKRAKETIIELVQQNNDDNNDDEFIDKSEVVE